MKRCVGLAAVFLVADSLFGAPLPEWKNPGIPVAAYLHPRMSSAARWIWREEKCLNEGDITYYRSGFELPPDARLVSFNLDYEDRADFYVNGKACAKEQIAGLFRPGRNLLAAKVTDTDGTRAGLIFRGVWRRADGKETVFVSDARTRCAVVEELGWTTPEFNDGRWRVAAEVGDATAHPWSKYRDMLTPYMSKAERAAYQVRLDSVFDSPLPAGLDSEPEPVAKIVYEGIRPKIDVNGVRFEPNIVLSAGLPGELYPDSMYIKMSSLEFKLARFSVRPLDWWRDDGNYDFSALDRSVLRLLSYAPDMRLQLSVGFSLWQWAQKHPDESVGYATCNPTVTYGDDFGPVIRPSAASLEFRELVADIIVKLGAYVKSRPWGNRVIALQPTFGLYGEWHTYGFARCPDTGRAMTTAFRRYLKDKYVTDEALRTAWNDPAVTLAEATVPNEAERTAGVGNYLLDPATHRKALDFFDCNSNVYADLLLYIAHCFKRELPGRLVGTYYGYVFCDHPPEGCNSLLDKVLSSADIDYLACPAGYEAENRHAGGPYVTRTVPSAFVRRGKLSICEDDQRFSWLKGYGVCVPFCLDTEAEDVACMKRGYLNRFFDGTGLQVIDPECSSCSRPDSFDRPEILQAIHDSQRVANAVGFVPAESGNRLAVVVDEKEALKMDGKCYTKCPPLKRFASAALRLYRCGVPFELVTEVDYAANRERYKAAYHLTPENLLDTPEQYAQRLLSIGGRVWTRPGEYLRHHAGLLLFHSGSAGPHEIRLPESAKGAVEMFSGRQYVGTTLAFETDGPETYLFRIAE